MVFRALRKEAVELNLMCRTESTNPDLRQKRSYSVCVCMGMRGGGGGREACPGLSVLLREHVEDTGFSVGPTLRAAPQKY